MMNDLTKAAFGLLLTGAFATGCSGAVDPIPDAGTNTNNTAPVDAGPSPFVGLVINELAAAGDPVDWVELYNGTNQTIDLSSFTFSDDATDPTKGAFVSGTTIAPGAYVVQEISDEAVGFKIGGDEALYLFDPTSSLVDEVDWEEGDSPAGFSYGRIPNGTGPFQTLAIPTPGSENVEGNPTCGDDDAAGAETCDGIDLAEATCESLGLGAGTLECNSTCDGYVTDGCGAVASPLVINELTSSGDDNIELYYSGDAPLDLEGYWIADSGYDPDDELTADNRYDLPAGTTIAAGGYLVLAKGTDHAFGLGGSGDALTLHDPTGAIVDATTYGADEAVISYCRIPNGTGAFKACSVATFGESNRDDGPVCGDDLAEGAEVCDGVDLGGETCQSQGFSGGDLACNASCNGFDISGCATTTSTTVVVNEARSSGDDEIELFNTTTDTVDISGWWVTDDGYDPADPGTADHRYDLPSGTEIGPGGFLVLIKGVDHTFGLGGEDGVFLYDALGVLRTRVLWPDGEAATSYCRQPDGVGAWGPCVAASFGGTNG